MKTKTPVLAAGFLLTFVVVSASACSSSSTPTTPDQDKGLEGQGVGAADSAPDTNPQGDKYPTENLGTSARKGEKPGNRIANYKFLGYPEADVAQGLKPISLAQFYDPAGSKYRIIHLQAAGVWCAACRAETEALLPMKSQLDAKKAVWLVSIAEGPTPGQASKQKDLDGWIAEFKSPFTHVLDPANANLGPFYDATALPWNANIDAKTMEILTAGTGGIVTSEGIVKEIDEALTLAASSKITTPQ